MRRVILLGVAMLPGMAVAQMDDTALRALAEPIGVVLGSEEACKLVVDRAAVDAYIEANVPAEAIQFTDMVQGITAYQRLRIEGMSAAQLQAHCTTVRRFAGQSGLAAPPAP